MSSPVRTRFAPSPTGFFHIGSARTALFSWLYARHTGGTFVLRIEDTDKARNTDEFLQVIYDSMKWLGMDWDEGPGVGGDFGPYKQSERNDIYNRYRDQLLANGRAYEKDGAIWLRLEGERYTETEYSYNGGEFWTTTRKADATIEPLTRTIEKVRAEPMRLNDQVRGYVERAEDRDFILFRANGEPVFHFVNVVDDIEMKITHVIRGEDHLSNTSKHVEIFKALGAPIPHYAHIPLILKTDGPGKMSKRDRGALIEEYQKRHYLPAAVRNYLCLLGWTPKDGKEMLPIADVIAQFELTDIHSANARFDEKKMAHMNQLHLRALNPESFAALAAPVLGEAGIVDDATPEDDIQRVLALVQPKCVSLESLPGFTKYFFSEDYAFDEAARANVSKKADPKARCAALLPHLETVADFADTAAVDAAFAAAGAAAGCKATDFFAPLRFAVSGLGSGPDMHPLLAALGRDKVLARLRRFTA